MGVYMGVLILFRSAAIGDVLYCAANLRNLSERPLNVVLLGGFVMLIAAFSVDVQMSARKHRYDRAERERRCRSEKQTF
jgi:hypothetical protein